MSDVNDQINILKKKLEVLQRKQDFFNQELQFLNKEIDKLKKIDLDTITTEEAKTITPVNIELEKEVQKTETVEFEPKISATPIQEKAKERTRINLPQRKSSWEKFIGENLINKIGIIITVLGVAIGAKYSIENDLISPLTRIILGYVTGLALIGVGIKLKKNYENYSAVLVSGALSTFYFITFAAYSFYGLFPQFLAFILMLVFTVFGVVAAINYNKQIIAHIGLVGAYAIPYLLSNESGNALILFSYMTIINIGILVIAYKKYWKPLHYSSFVFTWLIFTSWISFSYRLEEHIELALTTLFVFFTIFYAMLLVYKLRSSEKFKRVDIILILLNSSIFYAFGYGILADHETGSQLLGMFTLINAILHFVVSVVIYKKKLADPKLFYLIAGLVLTFITIAIPVQLDGNWVTLLWASEAALLYWLGKHKNLSVYEAMSYPLMLLALFSLLHDWDIAYSNYYYKENPLKPIFNITFLTSTLFLIAFTIINWVHNKSDSRVENQSSSTIANIMNFIIPGILIFVLYGSIYLEIESYWQNKYFESKLDITSEESYGLPVFNYDLKDFGKIWLINYSLLFIAGLILINIKRFKNRVLGIITLVGGLFATLVFLSGGLYILSELRESHLDQALSENYETSSFNIGIRYISMVFWVILLFALNKLIKWDFMKINFVKPFEIIVHGSILWVLSSEMLNLMDLAGTDQSYKLGLSILWGLYALLLIILGIWKNKQQLRITAIVLFSITLIKLFFYDIATLNTISKTIVFVSLGILLLIISFLYNKYKNKITDETED